MNPGGCIGIQLRPDFPGLHPMKSPGPVNPVPGCLQCYHSLPDLKISSTKSASPNSSFAAFRISSIVNPFRMSS